VARPNWGSKILRTVKELDTALDESSHYFRHFLGPGRRVAA